MKIKLHFEKPSLPKSQRIRDVYITSSISWDPLIPKLNKVPSLSWAYLPPLP